MSAAVALHLMRHGAPARTGTLLGRTDEAATAGGIAACARAAARLEVAGVVSSDLIRARACAEAAARGRPLTVDARWRELDFGAWDGLPPAEADSDALAAFWDDPDGCPPPGGERWSALCGRVRAAATGLPADTLVVTHGGAMRAALAVLCGFGVRQTWAFDLPYACVLSLAVWPGEPSVAQITGLMR